MSRSIPYFFYTFIVGIIVILGILAVFDPHFNVMFKEENIQAAIAKKLPFTTTKALTTFTVSTATVHFLPSGQVQVSGDFVAQPTFVETSRFEGSLGGTAGLDYHDGAFYLTKVHIDTLTGVPIFTKKGKALDNILGSLKKKMDQKLKELEIDPNDVATLFEVKGMKESLSEKLTERLASVPVYRFNGAKWWHMFASSALEKVEVTDKTVTATIGLGKIALIVMLVLMAIGVAILFIIALIKSGGAGEVGGALIEGAFEILTGFDF